MVKKKKKEWRTVTKAGQHHLLGRVSQKYSSLPAYSLITLHPTMKVENQFHYQAAFSITALKLFNIGIKFPQVFNDWSTSISV